MGILKGKVLTPKFMTAQITDAEDRVYFVPIKHTIGNYFLAEIDGKFFAFDLQGARKLTHRSKSGLGKSFQMIQYDTSHYSSLKPTTVALEKMLKANGLGKMDRRLHHILTILARREKENFGLWSVGKEDFETLELAQEYLDSLTKKTITVKDKNGVETEQELEIIHNVHNINDLVKIFEGEEGEFPDQVKEIKAYLKSLDVDHIVTPLRPITDFITDDLIATKASFQGEVVSRYQRLDGTLRNITNVPVKPPSNIMTYLIVGLIVGIGIAGVYGLSESGALDEVYKFTDNLSTIQEGFKGLPAPGAIQRSSTGGTDYTDASIMANYPGCDSLSAAINDGTIDYNNLSTNMKGMVDSCP
jgi:hypothetical protein